MIIDIEKLNCSDCPANHLIDSQLSKIKKWEKLRETVALSMLQINFYLLSESIPEIRFFYDKNTRYSRGLRPVLKQEFVGKDGTDDQLFKYMEEKGILIADCALCPLFKLGNNADKVNAANYCLENNTKPMLNINSKAPIITIFPSNRGIDVNLFPDIKKRIIKDYLFCQFSGLKKFVENSLNIIEDNK